MRDKCFRTGKETIYTGIGYYVYLPVTFPVQKHSLNTMGKESVRGWYGRTMCPQNVLYVYITSNIQWSLTIGNCTFLRQGILGATLLFSIFLVYKLLESSKHISLSVPTRGVLALPIMQETIPRYWKPEAPW